MKKILLALVLLLCLTACTSYKYTKVDYDDLVKKFDNKETFILLFNDNTSEGNLLKDTLNKVLNEFNLEAYVINPTKLSQEEKNNLRSIIYIETNGIAFIKEGVDSSKLSHVTDTNTLEKEIKQNLINHGFIDE